MIRTAIVFITCCLIVAGCTSNDNDQAGIAMSETQSTSAGLQAGAEPGQTSQPEATESESENADLEEPASPDSGDESSNDESTGELTVEIIEPDGVAPLERSGNTVRAEVAGWENREVPIWLVIVTPGDRQYPLRTFVGENDMAIWTEVFIGSEDEAGEDFSLVVVSASEDSLGATELQQLFDERIGTTGLLVMPGIEQLASQDVVRSE